MLSDSACNHKAESTSSTTKSVSQKMTLRDAAVEAAPVRTMPRSNSPLHFFKTSPYPSDHRAISAIFSLTNNADEGNLHNF